MLDCVGLVISFHTTQFRVSATINSKYVEDIMGEGDTYVCW